MKRREFISLLGGAAATWPLAARAQQPDRMRRIGVLMNLSEDDPEAQRLVATFREGLAQLGWTEGRNLRIDYRWSAGDIERIRRYAAELVALAPDVILAYGGSVVGPLQQVTHTVPIVFVEVIDPVGAGFVTSWRGRVAMPLASPCSNSASAGSGWSCSSKFRPALPRLSLSASPARPAVVGSWAQSRPWHRRLGWR